MYLYQSHRPPPLKKKRVAFLNVLNLCLISGVRRAEKQVTQMKLIRRQLRHTLCVPCNAEKDEKWCRKLTLVEKEAGTLNTYSSSMAFIAFSSGCIYVSLLLQQWKFFKKCIPLLFTTENINTLKSIKNREKKTF